MASKVKDEWVDVPLDTQSNTKDEWVDVPLESPSQQLQNKPTLSEKQPKDMSFKEILDWQAQHNAPNINPEAAQRAFSDFASAGMGEKLNAGISGIQRGGNYLLGNTTGDKGVLDAIRTGYKSELNASQAANQQSARQNPGSTVVGQFAAIAPQLLSGNPFALTTLTGEGMIRGALQSNASNPLDYAGDVAKGGLLSGGLQKGAEGIGMAASKIGKPILNKVGELARRGRDALTMQYLNPTQKQLTNKIKDAAPEYAEQARNTGLLDLFTSEKGAALKQRKASTSIRETQKELAKTLPDADIVDFLQTLNKKTVKIDKGESIDKAARKQVSELTDDLFRQVGKNENIGKMPISDVVSKKSEYGNLLYGTGGDAPKSKKGMELFTHALRDTEKAAAKNSPEYLRNMRQEEIGLELQKMLTRKVNAKPNLITNSLLASFGAIPAAVSGDPKYLIFSALGSKASRNFLLKSNVKSLDQINTLATKLKIDPKVVAYLLSRQNAGEK